MQSILKALLCAGLVFVVSVSTMFLGVHSATHEGQAAGVFFAVLIYIASAVGLFTFVLCFAGLPAPWKDVLIGQVQYVRARVDIATKTLLCAHPSSKVDHYYSYQFERILPDEVKAGKKIVILPKQSDFLLHFRDEGVIQLAAEGLACDVPQPLRAVPATA